ncbi:hypothetical protein DL98DRAFT_520587 [Cadophora sp. DSE1049]|nr:hypothetical protein DL98DRAFT_520587 [Cadophora sp. DSE1049]
MALQLQGIVDDSYMYTAITEPGTIRVIRLEPSLDIEAELHCSLECKRLDDYRDGVAGHYTALSYVWGTATDVRTIFVDGKRLLITASLHCALRHIRHAHHASYFWADGICIDQASVSDRNSQVSQMGSIYKTAQRTIIFLGPSCSSCSGVMGSIATNAPDFIATPRHRDILNKHILAHQWFTRVWTLQELVLSKNSWIQKGTTRVPWETFSQHVYEHSNDPADMERITDLVGIKGAYWSPFQTSSSPTKFLHDVLRQRRGAGVSDARDMVFGHLGLCPPMHENVIRSILPVNYSQTLSDVFEAVARQIILETGELSLLTEVERVQPEDRRESLPSWVPDWTISMKGRAAQQLIRKDASRAPEGHEFDKQEMFGAPHILTTRGTYLGSITALFPHAESPKVDSTPALKSRPIYTFSWAAEEEYRHMVDAVCALIRENYERPNIPARHDMPSSAASPEVPPPSTLSIDPAWYERDPMRHLATQLYLSFQERQEHLESESELELPRQPKLRSNPLQPHPHLASLILPALLGIKQRQTKNKIAALLNTGSVAVVSELARGGDVLCLLEGYKTLCLMRPKPYNEQRSGLAVPPGVGGVMDVSWVTIVPFARFEKCGPWDEVSGGVGMEEVVFAVH